MKLALATYCVWLPTRYFKIET